MIEVRDVSFGYPRQEVLCGITFSAPAGRLLAVAGPNGSGKTTLVRLLGGLLKPDRGRIMIDAAPLNSYSPRTLARKVAVVRQDTIPSFAYSVLETVMMGRTCHFGPLGFETDDDRHRVSEAMRETETEALGSRRLTQISGGERQRVYIARALAQDTPIILLDEPTSFLDLRHRLRLFDLLRRLQRMQGKTIIAITHDLNLAAQYCDDMLLLGGAGRYKHGPVKEVFQTELIEAFFGVHVLQGHLSGMDFVLPVGKKCP